MSGRYSVLRPLTMSEMERLAFELMEFFAPLKSNENHQMLGKSVSNGQIVPLSVNDFIDFLEKVKGISEIRKYLFHILSLVKKLEQANFVFCAGSNNNFSLGGEKCYFFMKELTDLQKVNLLWLAEALGLEYIQYKVQDFVIPITGIDDDGNVGIGTGTLINSNTVLTCGHVLTQMQVDNTIKIKNRHVAVADVKSHPNVDVGIIKLAQPVDLGFQVIFGETFVLDDILTMGFPPVPMTRDAYLISQTGEVNSLVQNFDGIWHIIYSSITRPGNSGGPIFTKRGQLVGISARHLERETDTDKNVVPFFEGITASEVIKALRELESDIDVLVEDYQ